MGSESGILVLGLVVGFLAIGAVTWNSVFGAAEANLMPNNTSSYYGVAQQTNVTVLSIGSLLPWCVVVGAALLFIMAIMKVTGGL